MEHSTVHTLLADLASTSPDQSTVDVGRAVTTGRRRIRRRRLLGSGSVALAVLAVVFAVAGVAQPSRHLTAPAVPFPTSGAPEFFDPMSVFAEFSWLPFTPTSTATTSGRSSLLVLASAATVPSATVGLTVVTANHEIANPVRSPLAVAPGTAARGQPADPLDGHQAQWTWSGPGTAALRWEYAPTAWAEVSVNGLPGDPRALARQIASAVRFGAYVPVRLPIRTAGVRAPLGPRLVTINYTSPETYRVAVAFGRPDSAPGDVLPLSVVASRPSIRGEISTATTVDGHPSRSTTGPDAHSGLSVFDVDGVDIAIDAVDRATVASLNGGLEGLYRTLDPRPDPATWY